MAEEWTAHGEGLIEGETLPERLPADPWPLVAAWFERAQAHAQTPNPDAMALATADAEGNPSVRVVLCKRIDPAGYLVFYTNRESRKGRELAQRPRAAVVMHWDRLERQVRIEGPVVESPDAESDAYFATRALVSRIGAWASEQSRPLEGREALLRRVERVVERFGLSMAELMGEGEAVVPRPPHWGGYRLWAERVELWCGGSGRIHDRAAWIRGLSPCVEGFETTPWQGSRLCP